MAASNVVRLALIGFGRIAPRHVEVFRALGCEIVASCNRSEEGRRRAQLAGISATYADAKEMLSRERPDGIICCPSFDRVFDVAQEIIPFQIPILLEKPPGTSFAEFEQLVQLTRHHRTAVMVGFNQRHYSVIQKAIEDAGGLQAISAVFIEWSEDPRYLISERGWTEDQVSKTIFANSLHGLDLLTYLAGAIPSPAIAATSQGDPCRWAMAVQGVSDRGVLTAFNSTWDSPGGWRLTLCSPGRRYVFAPLETCAVMKSGSRDLTKLEPEEYDQQYKPGFYRQGQIFLESIKDNHVLNAYSLASASPAMVLAETLTDACSHAKPTSDEISCLISNDTTTSAAARTTKFAAPN